jgi:MraZ protein
VELRSPETSFLGSHVNRIDAKGRVAAPADFRRALDGDPIRGFYCLPSLRGPYLECGGGDFILHFKKMIRQLEPFDEDRDALEEHLMGQIRSLPFDTEGRVVIPEPLRQHARLVERVLFQGRGETFLVATADGADDRLAATRERARAALQRLRNPNSGPSR